jgi:DNA-binding PadR family transcriptional regulator
MLREEPMHGYELMKRIEEYTEGRWSPSHSLLYTTLSQLEESGYITSEKDYKGEVERTVYSITNEGQDYLDEEVTQFAQMVSRMMSTMVDRPIGRIPRLFLENLPVEERKDLLIKLRTRLKEALKEIEKDLKKIEI